MSPARHFYLRRSRQVIERWEMLLLLLLLLGTTLRSWPEKPRSTFLVEVTVNFFPLSCSHTLIFLRGGIHGSLTKFLFGVGSAKINQELSVIFFSLTQNYLWGGIHQDQSGFVSHLFSPTQNSLWGGIQGSMACCLDFRLIPPSETF